MSKETYDRQAVLLLKVENDRRSDNPEKAISRLEGAMQHDPMNPELSTRLGELYFQQGKFAKAGRCWFLYEINDERVEKAISAFRGSVNNNPVLMLQELVSRSFFRVSALNEGQLEKLGNLLKAARMKIGTTPKFLQPLEQQLAKRMIKTHYPPGGQLHVNGFH